jgi:hypothetical protein
LFKFFLNTAILAIFLNTAILDTLDKEDILFVPENGLLKKYLEVWKITQEDMEETK